MEFAEIKELCAEHSRLLEKLEILKDSMKNRTWLEVVNPRNRGFYLSDAEREELLKIIDYRRLEIEVIITNLCEMRGKINES